MATADKLRYTSEAVDDIQAAINEMGVTVGNDIPLGEYGGKIRQISGGDEPDPIPEYRQVILDIVLTPAMGSLPISVPFYHAGAQTGTIEVDDGREPITITASPQRVPFEEYGKYRVKITRTDGAWHIGYGEFSILGTATYGTVTDGLVGVFMGEGVGINTSGYGFRDYSSIKRCTLPRVLTPRTSLQPGCFRYCTSLEEIILPTNLTTLNPADSLSRMYGCKRIIIPIATPKAISTTTFTGLTALTKIYVPDEGVELYKAAAGWMNYKNQIYPMSEM